MRTEIKDFKKVAVEMTRLLNKNVNITLFVQKYEGDNVLVGCQYFFFCMGVKTFNRNFAEAKKHGGYKNPFVPIYNEESYVIRNKYQEPSYETLHNRLDEVYRQYFTDDGEHELASVERTVIRLHQHLWYDDEKYVDVFKRADGNLVCINAKYTDLVASTPYENYNIVAIADLGKCEIQWQPLCYRVHTEEHKYHGAFVLPTNTNAKEILKAVLGEK
jgi:hypothetical protein